MLNFFYILKEKGNAAFFFKYLPVCMFFIFSGISNAGYSQSYYYFLNEINAPDAHVYTYKTFLVLQPDGRATARIQFNDPVSNELFLYELNLVDSSIEIADSTTKYLITSNTPKLIAGSHDTGFMVPRFIFTKKHDSLGYYYDPAGAQVKMPDGKWVAAKTNSSQQKTYEDLRHDAGFVGSFYFETDDFYKYIFDERTRAIPPPRDEKMFLIVVTNTGDHVIGKSTKTDLDNITGLFTNLAKGLGIIKIIPTFISGDNYSKASVELALKKLEAQKPASKDIIVFYYSGHGFRLPGDGNYPRMSFRTPENRLKQELGDNMELEAVDKRLKALHARVTIVLGDCCNTDIYTNPVLGDDAIKGKGGGFLGNFNLVNAQKLFLPPAPVSILIASVKKDHVSLSHPEIGGYFTHFFTAELEKNLWGYYNSSSLMFSGQSNASWLRIIVNSSKDAANKALRKVCGKTDNDRCDQQAEFSLKPLQ